MAMIVLILVTGIGLLIWLILKKKVSIPRAFAGHELCALTNVQIADWESTSGALVTPIFKPITPIVMLMIRVGVFVYAVFVQGAPIITLLCLM